MLSPRTENKESYRLSDIVAELSKNGYDGDSLVREARYNPFDGEHGPYVELSTREEIEIRRETPGFNPTEPAFVLFNEIEKLGLKPQLRRDGYDYIRIKLWD